jgi:hypothetical protein
MPYGRNCITKILLVTLLQSGFITVVGVICLPEIEAICRKKKSAAWPHSNAHTTFPKLSIIRRYTGRQGNPTEMNQTFPGIS